MKPIKVAVLTVALAIVASSMSAAIKVANLDVSANVVANCTITTTPVAFLAYDPVVVNAVADLDASGTVVVACTKGSSGLRIDLDNGANFLASRRMAGGVDFLGYGLFTDVARATAWGAGVGVGQLIPNAPNKTARTYTVYGRVPAGQDVGVAAYIDTVVATINY